MHLFVAFEEPRVRRGFVVKARPSAILWQVKYGCHPDDKSNISRSRQNVNSSSLSATTTLSVPSCGRRARKRTGRTLPFHKRYTGTKEFQFSANTLCTYRGSFVSRGILRCIVTLEMDI